jgi:hypothetical protein
MAFTENQKLDLFKEFQDKISQNLSWKIQKEIKSDYDPKFEKTMNDFVDLKYKMNRTNIQTKKNKEKIDDIDLLF